MSIRLDDIPESLRIDITDVRSAGYCVSGARGWFKTHDQDFRGFLANGMAARQFFQIDGHAVRVVEHKMMREAGRG